MSSTLRLFCFHFAGGRANRRLRRLIAETWRNRSPTCRRTIRADFELSETYECYPESSLECSMTIYGGLEDYEVEAVRLAAWSEMTAEAC